MVNDPNSPPGWNMGFDNSPESSEKNMFEASVRNSNTVLGNISKERLQADCHLGPGSTFRCVQFVR